MIKVNVIEHDSARTESLVLDTKILTFPGGEQHVSVDPSRKPAEIHITAELRTSADVMSLLMVTDALTRAYPNTPQVLYMPYVPYARQDRVANFGESLSIKVFCDLINAQNYHRVVIQDPHSDVTPALLDRVLVEDPRPSIGRAIATIMERNFPIRVPGQTVTLVSPDAGARKRVQGFAKHFGLNVLYADKVRNTITGEITGTDVQGNLPAGPMLIIDDICDGGRTFIEIAKAIRQKELDEGKRTDKTSNRSLYLYVTHGIFSKGLEPLLEHFTGVFTRNDWINHDRCDHV